MHEAITAAQRETPALFTVRLAPPITPIFHIAASGLYEETGYLSVRYTTVDCQTHAYTLLKFLGWLQETYKISKVVDENGQLRRRFATKCPTSQNPPQPEKHKKTADHRRQLQWLVKRLFLDIQMEGVSDSPFKSCFR